jgi:hypothetical protein
LLHTGLDCGALSQVCTLAPSRRVHAPGRYALAPGGSAIAVLGSGELILVLEVQSFHSACGRAGYFLALPKK